MSSLLPKTRNICKTLANFNKLSDPMCKGISQKTFSSLYKALDKHTSSSPSGRHLGHYKVAAKSEQLSLLHSQMMSIPGLTGHSPSRWHQVVDIMLEKKPKDWKIHRLCIIALQELDFNQVNRLTIGRPVQHKLEDQAILPDMQHRSCTAKQCHSAVLNKVLTFEIHRYKKQPLAYVENDAVGCFDRITNPLVLIFLQILGVAAPTLESLAKTWELSVHRIRSAYGISSHSYTNEAGYLLFGPD
jgi:hypothetical protein